MSASFIPERKQYSIVLIGQFSPAMFQPEWFYRNNIISLEEMDFARNQSSTCPIIVTPQLTLFKTSQFSVKIEQRRFQIVAEKEPAIILKDFIVKTFENLGGLSINAFGFNFSAHYQINSISDYHKIGDRLNPKKYWESLLGDEVSGDDRKSGLTSLQVQKTKKDVNGQISVTFQPSAYIKPGVYIACNDHTNIFDEDSSAERVTETIEKEFEKSIANLQNIQLNILTEVIKADE